IFWPGSGGNVYARAGVHVSRVTAAVSSIRRPRRRAPPTPYAGRPRLTLRLGKRAVRSITLTRIISTPSRLWRHPNQPRSGASTGPARTGRRLVSSVTARTRHAARRRAGHIPRYRGRSDHGGHIARQTCADEPDRGIGLVGFGAGEEPNAIVRPSRFMLALASDARRALGWQARLGAYAARVQRLATGGAPRLARSCVAAGAAALTSASVRCPERRLVASWRAAA